MVVKYKIIKNEFIDDEDILEKLEKYIAENNISIETETELVYTINEFLCDFLSELLDLSLDVVEFLDWDQDVEKYKHLIDDSNYIENPYTCCDDYSGYNYCPICGTKLK